MHLQESKKVLKHVNLFQDMNDIHLDLILMVCEEMNYLAGEYVFHQGDPGDALYIVANGELEVVLEQEGEEPKPLARLHRSQTFGEMILVDRGERTAGIRCRTDTQLLRITRERLLRLCQDYPEIGFRIMYRMAAELAMKLHARNLHIREQLFDYTPVLEEKHE